MKRVFLYETMLHGHRGVFLRYYRDALTHGGYDTVVCTEPLPEHDTPNLVDALDERAAANDCDIIHVLTFEGFGPKWIKYRNRLRRKGRPVVASYYLYNNLVGYVKGLPWDLLFGRGLLDRILVSDDFLAERSIPPWRRRKISYVPDPWDPLQFLPWDRSVAKARLSLPTNRKVLMVFGALKQRKGMELLFEAIERLGALNQNFLILLAGVLDPYYCTGTAAAMIAHLSAKGLIRVDNNYLDESSGSVYFHAADFVVCPYPLSFQGSSNVYTRACAAGTPAIVSDHGVMGRLVRRTGAGMVFQPESVEDLARCLREVLQLQTGPRLAAMVAAGHTLAAGKKLECFEQAVQAAYAQIDY